MKKFLNKSQSFHTSSSYINKNKSYLTNNKSSLITKAHTYKKITPQTSFLNLQTRNTSHYHDSLSSYLIPNQILKNNPNTTNNYILKDSFRTSTLSKEKPIMLFKKRKIAFGRLVPRTNPSSSVRKRIKVFSSITNDIDTAISDNTTTITPQTNSIHHKQRSCTPSKIFSLFKHGLSQKEYDRIKNYNCSCDTITTQPKQSFPMISTKKVVKNILPKEYNYSKRKSPDEVMRNAYHPVVRFQKKQITKHTNNIYKEINVDYSNTFTLINKLKFSEKFRTAEDLIDLEKNTNLYALIDKIISSSFKLGNEIDNIIEQKRKENKEDKRKKLLLKFKRILIRAAIHFKRLGVSLEEFLAMDLNHVKPFEYKDSVDLIFAIKNKDKDNVCRLIKENRFIVFDFDNVSKCIICIYMYSLDKHQFIGLRKGICMKLFHLWRIMALMFLHRIVLEEHRYILLHSIIILNR